MPKSRACYFKTKTKRNDSTYGQYIRAGIAGTDDVMPETDNLNGTQTYGPFVRSGLTGGTSYTLKYYWDNGKCYISKQATLSPSSYVYFDIPEGDEYNLKNITLGGSTPGTSDFGGVGLQIRKIGKGSLVMSKENPDFAGSPLSSRTARSAKPPPRARRAVGSIRASMFRPADSSTSADAPIGTTTTIWRGVALMGKEL